jgi:hypothetical protein
LFVSSPGPQPRAVTIKQGNPCSDALTICRPGQYDRRGQPQGLLKGTLFPAVDRCPGSERPASHFSFLQGAAMSR